MFLRNRIARITYKSSEINFTEIDNIEFKIVKSIDKKQSSAECTIYNLNNSIRQSILSVSGKLFLECGYRDIGYTLICGGDIVRTRNEKKETEYVTKFWISDGYYNLQRIISVSLSPGVSFKNVISSIKEQTDSEIGYISDDVLDQKLDSGYAFTGEVSILLSRLSTEYNFNYYYEDNILNIMSPSDNTKNKIVHLSYESGLLDEPPQEVVLKGYKEKQNDQTIRCLLNPNLNIGDQVSIKSINSEYVKKIVKVEHKGSLDSDSWESLLTVVDL